MGGVDTVSILPSSCGRVLVPSGDIRPSGDADVVLCVGSEWTVLRVVLRGRREYCCVSFSSPLIKGNRDEVLRRSGI